MKKYIKSFILATAASLLLTGCFGNKATKDSSNANDSNSVEANTQISGDITMNGSTSMEKLANSLSEVMMAEYPNVSVSVQFTGSGAGIEAVANGTVDIGNSSRNLKQEEKDKGLIENIVALDGIAIITDTNNPVKDITLEQLKNIYNGTITNWNEVGGNDQNIVVIGRESGSGTRAAFEEILGLKDKANYAQEIDSTGAVFGKVESIQGAIGYVSLDVVNESVKALAIDGNEPNIDNIKSGSYTLFRPFVMATKGEIAEQTEQVQEMFKFIKSEIGQGIVKEVGLIPAE